MVKKLQKQKVLSKLGTVAAWAFCFPLGVYINYKEWRKMKAKRRARADRLKLPPLRNRNSALSLAPSNPEEQRDNLFLKLPAELRNQIYELVAGEENVHIVRKDKLHSFRCYGLPRRDGLLTCSHDIYDIVESEEEGEVKRVAKLTGHCWKSSIASEDVSSSGLGVLGLLASCKAIYAELAPLLYSKPTFIFHNWSSFLSFCASIPPHRLRSINSLHIDAHYDSTLSLPLLESAINELDYSFLQPRSQKSPMLNQLPIYDPKDCKMPGSWPTTWMAVCALLEQMSGLKKLQINLNRNLFGGAVVNDEKVLGPIVRMGTRWKEDGRDMKLFHVCVDWEEKMNWLEDERKRGHDSVVVVRQVRWYHPPGTCCWAF